MKIIAEKSGMILSGNELLEATLRYDLVPVPVSLELKVVGNEHTKSLQMGDTLLVLDEQIPLTIIKRQIQDTDMVQGDALISIVYLLAVLSGCEKLIIPTHKAILLNNTSFASAYRACGVSANFGKDVPLMVFDCFYGKVPTFEIARRACEEACVIAFRDGNLNAIRLKELMDQEPVLQLDPMAIQYNHSSDKTLLPHFITINADGATVEDGLIGNKSANFYPNMDTRRLKNLRTVLVQKATVMRNLSPQFTAGDVFLVGDGKYVVLTAIHYWATGALGGQMGMCSKFWLSQVFDD